MASIVPDTTGSTTKIDRITVEVVYATPDEQPIIELQLKAGATVTEAVEASGFTSQYDIQTGVTPVGIYAERVEYNTVLRDGDRVEIYRALQLDPMQARRLRAEVQARKKANSAS